MKYLIISRPGESVVRDVTHDKLQKGKQMLQDSIDKGIVEGAYTLVGGGSVWIVNAESHESLARALRKLKLVGTHHVEVHPILDTREVMNAYETQMQQEKA
ncbi:MAG: hypothetical protein ICV68_00640 [Pyrinomonadaceae bacterium]|nr:hypothetical protein [Pyrinomonadaceae bacterium]